LFSRIVNAFFVRAADDLVDGDRGFDKFFEEDGDGFGDFAAVADGDKCLVIAAFKRHWGLINSLNLSTVVVI
jgi:hypothetical protein